MNVDVGPSRTDWTKLATRLVLATIGYNLIEAAVALWSGYVAGSVALMGFGLDSVIECAAATLLLWRLRVEARGAEPEVIEETERSVHRFVGITFVLLAAYVTLQAFWILVSRRPPEESTVGIILAAFSLMIMPLIAWGKIRAAREIGSAALTAEAKETLACSYLSLALLTGLVANSLAGWWWADPAAALIMVPWLIREGLEGIRGEGCHEECED